MLASWKAHFCTLLAIFASLVPYSNAADPTTSTSTAAAGLATLPPLRFQWNPSAKLNNFNMFSLMATYSTDINIDDNTLVGLARQAYRTMIGSTDWQGMIRQPGVVSVLKVGNEVYFASSIRGGGVVSFVYDWLDQSQYQDSQTNIKEQLVECQLILMTRAAEGSGDEVKDGHRVNGNCAEVMAVHMYQVAHPQEDIKTKGAVVTSYGVDSFGNRGQINLRACGTRKTVPLEWGCAQLMDYLNIRVVYDIQQAQMTDMTAAPITTNDQLPLCQKS